MSVIAKAINASVPSVKRLTPAAARELERAVKQALPDKPDALIESFLVTLHSLICHFCEWEQRERRRQPSKIKTELRQLARHIDTLQASIRRLSVEARAEIDFDISPGFELPANFLAAERPVKWRNPYAKRTRKRTERAAKQPAPPTSYYIDPASVTLTRLRQAIDTTLHEPAKSGAPFRLPWHHLAWEVGRAMQRHLSIEPSITSGSHFQLLLDACLQAGLTTIRSNRRVPEDLRPYTRSAILTLQPLKSQAGIKPSKK